MAGYAQIFQGVEMVDAVLTQYVSIATLIISVYVLGATWEDVSR